MAFDSVANLLETTLGAARTSGSTTFTVKAGDGVRFGTFVSLLFAATPKSNVAATGRFIDRTKVAYYRATGRTGDDLTSCALVEGTDQDYAAGDLLGVYVTAQHLTQIQEDLNGFTSAGRALLDDPDAASQRQTLGLVPGTDVLSPGGNGSALTVLPTGAETPQTLGLLFAKEYHAKLYGVIADGTTDDTVKLQALFNLVDADGGGMILLPPGRMRTTARLTLPKKTTVRGQGSKVSIIAADHDGTALENLQPVNSATRTYLRLEDFGLECTRNTNTGAGFTDSCGTFVYLHKVSVTGFMFGFIFDQSEVAHATECEADFQLSGGAGFWLVNGDTHRANSSTQFTNVVTIKNCQVNQNPDVNCIVDDGGYSHSFIDNNYGGGINGLRLAGAVGVTVTGGDWEGQSGSPISLRNNTAYNSLSTGSPIVVGSSSSVTISGMQFSPTGTNPCLDIGSCVNLVLCGNSMGGSAPLNTLNNVRTFVSFGNCLSNGDPPTYAGNPNERLIMDAGIAVMNGMDLANYGVTTKPLIYGYVNWVDATHDFRGISIDFNDYGSGAGSDLIHLTMGGAAVFRVAKDGGVVTTSAVTAANVAVGGVQVVGARGAAVADSDGSQADNTRAINALLARLRATGGHGLIAD